MSSVKVRGQRQGGFEGGLVKRWGCKQKSGPLHVILLLVVDGKVCGGLQTLWRLPVPPPTRARQPGLLGVVCVKECWERKRKAVWSSAG